jgi:hypothetical protein
MKFTIGREAKGRIASIETVIEKENCKSSAIDFAADDSVAPFEYQRCSKDEKVIQKLAYHIPVRIVLSTTLQHGKEHVRIQAYYENGITKIHRMVWHQFEQEIKKRWFDKLSKYKVGV